MLSLSPSLPDPAAALETNPGLCEKERIGASHKQSLSDLCSCRVTLGLCAETLAERLVNGERSDDENNSRPHQEEFARTLSDRSTNVTSLWLQVKPVQPPDSNPLREL